MNIPTAAAGNLLRSNQSLRDGLRVWDALLYQAHTGDYAQTRHAMSVLLRLSRLLERENRRRQLQEERRLYHAITRNRPELRPLVKELRRDQRAVAESIRDFRQALAEFNTSGNSRGVVAVGEQVARRLRKHTEREEAELLPALKPEPAPVETPAGRFAALLGQRP